MSTSTPAHELSVEQRRAEIARILSAGILRLRKLRKGPRQPTRRKPETSAESPGEDLEVRPETVLSVHTG